MTGQQPTAQQRALADAITAKVADRLRSQVGPAGLGDDLLTRAKYIIRNKLISAGVPVWAVEMLMQGVEKALEQLLKATEAGEG